MSDLARIQKELRDDLGYTYLCIQSTTTGIKLTAHEFPSMVVAATFLFDRYGNLPGKNLL